MGNASGEASFQLGVPSLPALLGVSIFAQSLVVSPGANALGVVTSVFILLSIEAVAHLGPDGVPPTVTDMHALLGLATGAAALMLGLPLILLPVALSGPGVLRSAR